MKSSKNHVKYAISFPPRPLQGPPVGIFGRLPKQNPQTPTPSPSNGNNMTNQGGTPTLVNRGRPSGSTSSQTTPGYMNNLDNQSPLSVQLGDQAGNNTPVEQQTQQISQNQRSSTPSTSSKAAGINENGRCHIPPKRELNDNRTGTEVHNAINHDKKAKFNKNGQNDIRTGGPNMAQINKSGRCHIPLMTNNKPSSRELTSKSANLGGLVPPAGGLIGALLAGKGHRRSGWHRGTAIGGGMVGTSLPYGLLGAGLGGLAGAGVGALGGQAGTGAAAGAALGGLTGTGYGAYKGYKGVKEQLKPTEDTATDQAKADQDKEEKHEKEGNYNLGTYLGRMAGSLDRGRVG